MAENNKAPEIEPIESINKPTSNVIITEKSQKCIADLQKSGLTMETINSYKDYLKVSDDGYTLSYPELLENKKSEYWTKKIYNRTKNKYIRPELQQSRIFRPLALTVNILRDTSFPICIVEGEKKAMMAVQLGIYCIAISGVWCWKKRIKKIEDENKNSGSIYTTPIDNGEPIEDEQEENNDLTLDVIEDFEKINLKGRVVYLCFDNDLWEKEQVKRALFTFAAQLTGVYGAIVKIIYLPQTDEKLGLDDFLIKYGIEEYRKLEQQAETVDLKTIQKALSGVPNIKNEFPIEIFNSDMQDFIKDASKRIDGSIDYIASGILGGAATLMSGTHKLCVNALSEWVEPPNLWISCIGSPSSKKSPCLNISKNEVDFFDNQFSTEYEQQVKEYKSKLAAYLNQKKSERGEPPEPPQRQRLTMQNGTTEAIQQAVYYNEHGCKRGITIWNDELASHFKGLGQYKNNSGNDEEYFFLCCYCQRYSVMRKSNNTDFVIYPSHSIIGTMQPRVLYNTLLKQGLTSTNGQLERWLFVTTDYVETGLQYEGNKPFDKTALQVAYKHLFDRKEEKLYLFTAEAQKAFNKYCFNITQRKKDRNMPEILKSYIQKQTNYVARFSLILHCLNNPEITLINETTLNKAIKLSEYFIKSFEKIAISRAANNDIVQRTLSMLQIRKIRKISPTRLHKMNVSLFKDKEKALIVLEHLQDMAYGRIVKSGSGASFVFF